MKTRHKPEVVEVREISGHDFLARYVIARDPDPASAKPYHLRRLLRDGSNINSTFPTLWEVRGAALFELEKLEAEGATIGEAFVPAPPAFPK